MYIAGDTLLRGGYFNKRLRCIIFSCVYSCVIILAVCVTPDVAAPVSSVYQPPAVQGQQASGIYEQGARFDTSKPANIPVNVAVMIYTERT